MGAVPQQFQDHLVIGHVVLLCLLETQLYLKHAITHVRGWHVLLLRPLILLLVTGGFALMLIML